MHKKKLSAENIKELVDDEIEAIEQYDDALNDTDDTDEIATIEHIRDEEKEHIDELNGMDKMVDDMDSEQAWEDFKSGYSDFVEHHVTSGQVNKAKDGDTSSIEGKLDTLLAIQQEQMVDIERLTDVIPQLKGEIEENKRLEESEEGEEGDPMADLFGGGDVAVGDDTEGVDDFADIPDDEDDYTDDEIAMMDEDGEETVESDDGDTIEVESDTEVVEDDGDEYEVVKDGSVEIEDSDDGESNDEESDNEDSDNEESDDDEDDDFIPIEDIMAEDDDDEDSEEDDDEEESDDEELDEVLEKMVHTMAKMNKAIKKLTAQVEHLERENRAMKKSMTVQPMHNHGQRPIPIKKQIGVVSKPPVGVGYTANQVGGVDERSIPFTKSTPQQILDACNRVARL